MRARSCSAMRVADERPDHLDRHLGVGPAGEFLRCRERRAAARIPARRGRRRGPVPRASRRQNRAAEPRRGWIHNARSTYRTDPTRIPHEGHCAPPLPAQLRDAAQAIDFTCVSEPEAAGDEAAATAGNLRGWGPPAQATGEMSASDRLANPAAMRAPTGGLEPRHSQSPGATAWPVRLIASLAALMTSGGIA